MVPYEITSSVTDSAVSARKTLSKSKFLRNTNTNKTKSSDPDEGLEKVRRAELKFCFSALNESHRHFGLSTSHDVNILRTGTAHC